MLLALVAAVVVQQAPVDRDCQDDNGTDRCAASEQARARDLLGVASIEDESSAGAQVYRVLFVDGYGRDMPAISFERRLNEPPKVAIYGTEGRRLSGPVSSRAWEEVVRRSLNADARAVRPEAEVAASDEPTFCLHSWVATVEIAESVYGRPGIRRRTEDSCSGGFTVAYGFDLADLAIKALPACERLDTEQHRNDVTRLAACLRLEGDTVAAADLRNARGEAPRPRDGVTRQDWSLWLGGERGARLDWNGEIVEEPKVYVMNQPSPPTVAGFMAGKAREFERLSINPSRFVGTSSHDGWVEGYITYEIPGDQSFPILMTAAYRQTWTFSGAQQWKLTRWTVGPFEPIERPE